LPVGGLGQDLVDQTCGRVASATCPARGAQASLAGEGDQTLESARGTTQAGEAAGQDAAVQVSAKLVLDEVRVADARIVAATCLIQKRFEMAAYDGVQDGLVGLAPSVRSCHGPRGGAGRALEEQGRECGRGHCVARSGLHGMDIEAGGLDVSAGVVQVRAC